MSQRKLNISSWCRLGLLVILVMVLPLLCVGVTYGRYRAQTVSNLVFAPEGLSQIYLGQSVESDGALTGMPDEWTVSEDGVYSMGFCVSNGDAADSFASEDKMACVRLLAGPALKNGGDKAVLTLTVAGEQGETSYTATPVAIPADTVLYNKFGEGWVFCFYDEEGQELTWKLEGGTRSVIPMKLELSEAELTGECILQLQAQDTRATSWKSVISPIAGEVTSDCLVPGGQTVLLGEWNTEQAAMEFDITLQADGGTSDGSLIYQNNEYFTVAGDADSLTLTDGEPRTVTVTLTLTDAGLAARTEATDAEFAIQWTAGEETLEATFRITLPAWEGQESGAEESTEAETPGESESTGEGSEAESEAGEPEGAEESESAVNGTETEAEESGSAAEGTGTEAEETGSAADGTEAEGGESESAAEGTEAAQAEADESAESSGLLTEQNEADESTEAGETQESAENSVEAAAETTSLTGLKLETLEYFQPEGFLPIQVRLPEGCTYIELTLYDSETGEAGGVPAFTRYSADGGDTWYMLYYGGTIRLIAEELADMMPVLLDLSAAQLTAEQAAVIRAIAYSETANSDPVEISSLPTVQVPAAGETAVFLSGAETEMNLTLPTEWSDTCTLMRTVEILKTDEAGSVAYQTVTSDEHHLKMTMDTGTMTIAADEFLTPAGSYRLTLTWIYDGVEIAKTQLAFFVNHSG